MHQLTVNERAGLSLTDAAKVVAFSEKEVKITLKDGRKLVVTGEGLDIALFNEQSGALSLGGNISSIKYLCGDNFLKKLVK